MNNNDNADRWNGRRDKDSTPTDCVDLDALAVGYRDGDPASIRWLATHLLDVSPEHQRETLTWLLEHGEHLGGDA
ncbi:hypothetical protein OAG48_00405 [bacterium]|nr:hypothetical protein [bacterium]